ncbi:LADA_0D12310g1_1 [Lachancea dasiensis]|uniref:LADA_0D12310g1_1 n=1 Tax=Lachancea dasiensis TaxID=1072105 RepID=A0A1G4J8A6_9SACH|nr:LADA_0D12310g1_1 [Lachancea dasiensis]
MDSNECDEHARIRDDDSHSQNDDVIEIESCAEDEVELQQAAELRHSDFRERRNPLGHFTTREPNALRSSTDTRTHHNTHTSDDDEIEVVDERILEDGGPLNPYSEFVDLDREVPIRVAQIRPRPPSATEEDQDIIFVGQNNASSAPGIMLQLPGNERIMTSASPLEQPWRRSFQNHQPRYFNSGRTTSRLLSRTARRAQRLFVHDSDSPGNQSHTSGGNIHNHERANRIRQRLRSSPSAARSTFPISQSDLAARISALPPNVLSVFENEIPEDEAHALLMAADGSEGPGAHELTQLYLLYRRQLPSRRNERGTARPNAQTRHFERTNAHRSDLPPPSERFPDPTLYQPISMRTRMLPNFGHYLGRDMDEARETQSIIEMIQAREELENDNRKRKFMESSKLQQNEFIARATKLPKGYSSSFDTKPSLGISIPGRGKDEIISVVDEEESNDFMEVPACTLCGVELGVGIPEDYKGLSSEDRGVSFEALVAKYHFSCPYRTLLSITDADRDLSRRTYVANCGHMFCGRCFYRLSSMVGQTRSAKRDFKGVSGPSHPDNFAPKRCPAEHCNYLLRAKYRMREIFF